MFAVRDVGVEPDDVCDPHARPVEDGEHVLKALRRLRVRVFGARPVGFHPELARHENHSGVGRREGDLAAVAVSRERRGERGWIDRDAARDRGGHRSRRVCVDSAAPVRTARSFRISLLNRDARLGSPTPKRVPRGRESECAARSSLARDPNERRERCFDDPTRDSHPPRARGIARGGATWCATLSRRFATKGRGKSFGLG